VPRNDALPQAVGCVARRVSIVRRVSGSAALATAIVRIGATGSMTMRMACAGLMRVVWRGAEVLEGLMLLAPAVLDRREVENPSDRPRQEQRHHQRQQLPRARWVTQTAGGSHEHAGRMAVALHAGK